MTRRGPLVVAGVAVGLLALVARPGSADPAHSRPQGPAAAHFPPDFPVLTDQEWGFRLGGFGGVHAGASLHHVPVIFVHGNNVDAADWYTVRDEFKAAGWTMQELYALSYNGLGGNNGIATMNMNPQRQQEHMDMGWDGQTRITNNEVNVPDLYAFIRAVQAYTGTTRFSLVTHSLGVTVARRALKAHPELRGDLVAFVGIAGGNHGTSFCPPGSEGNVVSCDEIAAGTPWLAALNGPEGSDETYAPAKWLTIYDGSGAGDPAYAGNYAQSPQLRGADNRQFPGTYHNDLREDPPMVAVYRQFLETVEAAVPASSATGLAPGSASGSRLPHVTAASVKAARSTRPARMPPTGGGVPVGVGLSMLALWIGLKRLIFQGFGFRRTPRDC
jgi:pimeloyl-ACP methyl ester carboxylesterase